MYCYISNKCQIVVSSLLVCLFGILLYQISVRLYVCSLYGIACCRVFSLVAYAVTLIVCCLAVLCVCFCVLCFGRGGPDCYHDRAKTNKLKK